VIGDAHRGPRFPRLGVIVRTSQPFVSIEATVSPVEKSSTWAPPPKALTRGGEQVLAHRKPQRPDRPNASA
jgi:hypothetical protein